jgi:hypothetical protein
MPDRLALTAPVSVTFADLLRHHPAALDGVTFFSVNPQSPHRLPKARSVATLVADYRQGAVDLVDGLDPLYLGQVGGIPKAQVQISPNHTWFDIEFNQRGGSQRAGQRRHVDLRRSGRAQGLCGGLRPLRRRARPARHH